MTLPDEQVLTSPASQETQEHLGSWPALALTDAEVESLSDFEANEIIFRPEWSQTSKVRGAERNLPSSKGMIPPHYF